MIIPLFLNMTYDSYNTYIVKISLSQMYVKVSLSESFLAATKDFDLCTLYTVYPIVFTQVQQIAAMS